MIDFFLFLLFLFLLFLFLLFLVLFFLLFPLVLLFFLFLLVLLGNMEGNLACVPCVSYQVEGAVRASHPCFPVSRLVSIENTHAQCGGKVLPIEYLDDLTKLAQVRYASVFFFFS